MTRNERMVRELRAEPASRAFEWMLAASGRLRLAAAVVAIAVAALMSLAPGVDSPASAQVDARHHAALDSR